MGDSIGLFSIQQGGQPGAINLGPSDPSAMGLV
jgi:hypothetical protein